MGAFSIHSTTTEKCGTGTDEQKLCHPNRDWGYFLGNQDTATIVAKSVENICLSTWVSMHRSVCKWSQRTTVDFVPQDLSTFLSRVPQLVLGLVS